MATERLSMLPAGREWPPRRHLQPVPDGVIEIVGVLMRDAELRVGAGGGRGVLHLELETGKGFPYEASQPVDGNPAALQAAAALQQRLRRGISVRIRARGCLPRTDHGLAVLHLLDVIGVDPL